MGDLKLAKQLELVLSCNAGKKAPFPLYVAFTMTM